jgi:hypothetical protein
MIDIGRAHQIAGRVPTGQVTNSAEIHQFIQDRGLNRCSPSHSFGDFANFRVVYFIAQSEHATSFQARFGGMPLNRKDWRMRELAARRAAGSPAAKRKDGGAGAVMASLAHFVVVPFEQTRGRGRRRPSADRGTLPGSSIQRSWQGRRRLLADRRPRSWRVAEASSLRRWGGCRIIWRTKFRDTEYCCFRSRQTSLF